MLEMLRAKVALMKKNNQMKNDYLDDYRLYKRWNYKNPETKTQCSREARILRQTHVIEKGMSLSAPRKGFGLEKINDLFRFLDDYITLGFPTDSIPFQNAICVITKYIEFQKNNFNFVNEELNRKIEKYLKYVPEIFESGIKHASLSEMQKSINGQFPEFFMSRHSIRQFSDKTVAYDDIKKSVQLAMKAPTACNRQACRVYYYSDNRTNAELGKLIAGDTGFENEVKNYLVVTSDLSAFYDSFERNQIYIEAGLFAMALVQALHYNGIASCILQNGETPEKNTQFKQICDNIPENEKIALFIAIGYYKDEFNYAVSKRKNINDVLISK